MRSLIRENQESNNSFPEDFCNINKGHMKWDNLLDTFIKESGMLQEIREV